MRNTILSLDEGKLREASIYSLITGQEENDNSLLRNRMKHVLSIGIKNELTDRQRSCIYEYYFTDQSVAQIAEGMNITAATVYKHIRKAKQRLKKCAQYL